MSDLPVTVTLAGAQPTSPSVLRQDVLDRVSATDPGYTGNLPGSLIEDLLSTAVGALITCDQALVESINSISPLLANLFIMYQLGQVYGVVPGKGYNTSVYVVFTGDPGYIVPRGFIVSDGTYQYVVQDGGAVGSDGTTDPLYAIATVSGSWSVPAASIIDLVTSVPTGFSLSVTNPQAGIPSQSAQTAESYRAQVLQAGLAASQGMARYLKTLLANVSGVQARLISVLQVNGGGWEVICGGGDPYDVAYAIYRALFDVSTLVGSTISIINVTAANPGVVTTDINHGYTTGQSVTISGVDPTNYNATYATITVVDEKTFSLGVDTSGYPAYVSGGACSPNNRNVTVGLIDYPNVYNVTFVSPPQQAVTMTVTWNTMATNFTQDLEVSQLAAPALIDYVNSITVGQPMNLFELQTTFQAAVASVLPPALLTRLVFTVSINEIVTNPDAGTGIIAGDPESYFQAAVGSVTVNRG